MLSSLTDLGPADVLAAAEDALRKRREAQVADLLAVLQWADLHSGDPQDEPGAVPVRYGGDRLVQVGGHGTPQVAELCVHELAIARQTHPNATRATMADALDLRHRLPRTWGQVLELACEPWVAAKVARITRRLDPEACELVDLAVAEAIAGQSPGRVIAIAEAKTIEADTAAHAARLDAERRRRGVWISRTDPETGTRTVFSRIEPGDATWIDATLERIVTALQARPDILRAHHPDLPAALDDLTHDELRAIAFGWLARPDDIRELLAARCHRAGPTPRPASPASRTTRPWSTCTSTKPPSPAPGSSGSRSSARCCSNRSSPCSATPTSPSTPSSTSTTTPASTPTRSPPASPNASDCAAPATSSPTPPAPPR